MYKLLILPLLLFLLIIAQVGSSQGFHQSGRSFRGLAMGNTGISSAHDNDAIFYNPATLPNLQRNFIDFLSVQVSASQSIDKLFDLISGLQLDLGEEDERLLNAEATSGLLGVLAMINFNYQSIDRGFNVSAILAYDLDHIYQIDTNAQQGIAGVFSTRFDQITEVAMSFPFGLGRFVLAGGAKRIVRKQGNYNYSLAESKAGKKPPSIGDFSVEESFAGDLGFLYRQPGNLRFRMGMSVLNVGGLKFKNDPSYDWPQEVNFGMSIGPTLGRWRSIIAFDYRDILRKGGQYYPGQENTSSVERTHAGIELGYFVENKTFALLNLRAGLNQGLPTYGVEMNFLFGRTLVLGYTHHAEYIGFSGSKIAVPSNTVYVSFGH
ncbi:MAG: hypothetical protein JJV97_04705 [SAR324 cluster bacterium]|nr:hypothetical protein [SAR324 cluster bacterium]